MMLVQVQVQVQELELEQVQVQVLVLVQALELVQVQRVGMLTPAVAVELTNSSSLRTRRHASRAKLPRWRYSSSYCLASPPCT